MQAASPNHSLVMRIILLGNAGAGKSSMARRIIGDKPIPSLSLDQIAWDQGPKRKPLEVSVRLLRDFIQNNEEWVLKGCYGDLVEAALLQVVGPAAITAAIAAEAEAAVRRDQVREALLRDLEAARSAADRAFRQYDAADPAMMSTA